MSSEQIDRFREAARELECDEDEDAFKEKLGVIARQNPKDSAMQIYRLSAVPPLSPDWDHLSTSRGPLWTRASNPQEARTFVAKKTVIATKPLVPNAPIQPYQSPWLDDKQSTCVVDTTRDDVQDGQVLDQSGLNLSANNGCA
jgi:hypothetical protein